MLVAFLDQMVVRLVEFYAHVPIGAFVRMGQDCKSYHRCFLAIKKYQASCLILNVCVGLNLVFRVCVWDKKYF